jgi:hypothetical protein
MFIKLISACIEGSEKHGVYYFKTPNSTSAIIYLLSSNAPITIYPKHPLSNRPFHPRAGPKYLSLGIFIAVPPSQQSLWGCLIIALGVSGSSALLIRLFSFHLIDISSRGVLPL